MKFKVAQHCASPEREMVMVFDDEGKLLASIYPHGLGLHIVSKHMTGVRSTGGPPPGVLVVLEPS